MSYRIQYRRATAAVATANKVVLAAGEPGLETDTGKVKVGDGVTAWNTLPYQPSTVSVAAAQAAAIAAAAGDATTKAGDAQAAAAVDAAAKVDALDASLPSTYLTAFKPEKYGAVGDGVADDYPAFAAMAVAVALVPRAAIHISGNHYLSDGVGFDCEDLEIYLAAGSHVFTTAATTLMGGTLCAIGYNGAGVSTTPTRKSVKIHGPGKVTGWTGGINENAIGIVRYDRVLVDGPHVNAGNKGVTAQIACADITIRNITSDTCVKNVVSVEDQALSVKSIVEDIKFGTSGAHAVFVSAGWARVRRIVGAGAHTAGSNSAGAVHVTTAATLLWGEVTDVSITNCYAAKGIVVSQAQGGRVERISIGASGGNAVEIYNCVNGLEVGVVEAPASLNGVAANGTTPAGRLRRTDSDGTSRRALVAGEATMDRLNIASTTIALSTGTMRLGYFEATKTETITKVRVITGGAVATTSSLIRAGIYSVADNGTLTLVASTANDTTWLAATNTAYTKTLSAPFLKVAGQRYAIGVLGVYTAGTMQAIGNTLAGGVATEAALSPKIAGVVTGLADLPSSVVNGVSAGQANDSAAMPYYAVAP